MERLTTNKNVSEMGMFELALNCCYEKEALARYRDFEMDMDVRDFARKLMTTLANDDMPTDDDLFDEEIMENLIYDPFSDVKGLIALFYRNLWAMAELRESLKEYEDAEEQGLLLRLPCKVGDEFWIIAYKSKVITHVKCSGFAIQEDIPNEIKHRYVWLDSVENPRDYWKLNFDDFKVQCFLTKEEAEQALKQMGE